MGIQGLLVGLKPYTVQGNLLDYAGQSLAVDTSSWMHKSIYSIADHYVECQERNTIDSRCIDVSARYVSQRCRELHDGFRIHTVYLVMDGKRCPLKAVTNQERDDRRQEQLRLARQYKKQRSNDSFEKYKSCIKIVDALTIPVVQKVAKLLPYVELIWSPYEADAQLAQLCIEQRAAACITEDSDVLVYSAAAQVAFPIIYKLDRNTGNADVLSMNWLLKNQPPSTERTDQKTVSQLQVVLSILQSRQQQNPGWGTRLFVMGCVLAGCDYAPRQIQGVGLVNAFKLVREAGITGSDKNLAKIFRYILSSALKAKSRHSIKDVDALEEQLSQSEAVFYYHPVQRNDGTVVHFTLQTVPCAPKLDRFADCSFLGSLVANENEDPGIIPKQTQPIKTKPVPTTPPRQRRRVLRPPSSATSSLSSPSVDPITTKTIPNFVTVYKASKTVINPYTTAGQHELRRKNAFESYRRRHENSTDIDRIRHIVQTKLPVRRDVRAVKRKFPKVGEKDVLSPPKRSRFEASQEEPTSHRSPERTRTRPSPKRSRFEVQEPSQRRPHSPPNKKHPTLEPGCGIFQDAQRSRFEVDLMQEATTNHRSPERTRARLPSKRSRLEVQEPFPRQRPKRTRSPLNKRQPTLEPGYGIFQDTQVTVEKGKCYFERDPLQDHKPAPTAAETPAGFRYSAGLEDISPLPDAFSEQSPFFSNGNTMKINGTLAANPQPDPKMDSVNLFVPSSPNLLLEPSQESYGDEDDDLEDLEDIRHVRRVTLAHQSYEDRTTPAAARQPIDGVELQGNDRDDDDFAVLNVHTTVRTPPCYLPIEPSGTKPTYESTSTRSSFRHLSSFLSKDRKRRKKGQTSILSHFKFR